jgi:hypothetical protein
VSVTVSNVPGTNYQPSLDVLTNLAGAALSNSVAREQWLSNWFNSAEYGQRTNAGALLDLVTNAMSGVFSDMDGAVTALGAAPEVAPGASGDFWTWEFCGAERNWNPDQVIPGIWTFIKSFCTWVLLIEFAVFVSRLFFETANMAANSLASTQGSTLGAVTLVGMFTNPLTVLPAVAAYILLPLGVLTVVGSVLGWIISFALDYFSQAAGATDWVSYCGSNPALWLVEHAFPINLFVTLVLLRVTVHFLAAKAALAIGGLLRLTLGDEV